MDVDCFGRSIYTIDSRSYRHQIKMSSKVDCRLEQLFSWSHRKRVLDNLEINDKLCIYLHMNENYIIKITDLSDYTWTGKFKGIAMEINDFFIELANDNFGEIIQYNSQFEGYNERHKRQYDVDKYSYWIRYDYKKGYSKIEMTKGIKSIFDNYVNNEFTYEEMIKKVRINYYRPSSKNYYFG